MSDDRLDEIRARVLFESKWLDADGDVALVADACPACGMDHDGNYVIHRANCEAYEDEKRLFHLRHNYGEQALEDVKYLLELLATSRDTA